MYIPYLPKEKASLFIADCKIENATVITPPPIASLPYSMRRHADLGICIISEKTAVCPPDTCAYYNNVLSRYGYRIIEGKKSIGSNYPKDCAYNVGIVGKRCFMKKSACDSILLEELIKAGMEIVNVNQGYSKCSLCALDENTIITADESIKKAAEGLGMKVFFTSNKGIVLEGFQNGFIGGCLGKLDAKTLLSHGNLSMLEEGNTLLKNLNKNGFEVKSIKEGDVIDIGSVIPLM
ncbi:MAG: hypothetical protein UIL37_02215 [Clostridia bacterium]|nr:hypothetical protein [Clostridia bacterium]